MDPYIGCLTSTCPIMLSNWIGLLDISFKLLDIEKRQTHFTYLESKHIPNYVKELLKAMNICRCLTFNHMGKHHLFHETIPISNKHSLWVWVSCFDTILFLKSAFHKYLTQPNISKRFSQSQCALSISTHFVCSRWKQYICNLQSYLISKEKVFYLILYTILLPWEDMAWFILRYPIYFKNELSLLITNCYGMRGRVSKSHHVQTDFCMKL